VFDGGEAGETWRHSTLSFYDARMPLAAGHVERFFSHPSFQFSQGVHPDVVAPGQPVFLSDVCHHELVEVAHRRFRQDPAAVRSFAWVGDEYLVVHDELHLREPIPSHWHLQVVSDEVQGDANSGFRFRGRFGVDLAVWLPGQCFDGEKIDRLATVENGGKPEDWFAMQHLQLDRQQADDYLAILKPLATGEPAQLQATPLRLAGRIAGVSVETVTGRDLLWFVRGQCEWKEGSVSFSGNYGAFLDRQDKKTFILLDAGKIQTDNVLLCSDGPKVVLEQTPDGVTLKAEGQGTVHGQAGAVSFRHEVSGSLDLTLPAVAN